MSRNAARAIVAGMARVHPAWDPLERVVGLDLAGWFMWMFEVRAARGRVLHAYKHRWTRRYLYLGADGAYGYVEPDRYRRIDLADALELVLEPWWEMPGVPVEDIAAAWAAIDRAAREAP